jgi:hypothetical protein
MPLAANIISPRSENHDAFAKQLSDAMQAAPRASSSSRGWHLETQVTIDFLAAGHSRHLFKGLANLSTSLAVHVPQDKKNPRDQNISFAPLRSERPCPVF